MTTAAAIPPATAKPRRRRWVRWVLVALVLVVLLPIGLYVYSAIANGNAWEAAVAEAESDLPRWRLLEIEADRPKVPDAENSALHMIAITRKGGLGSVSGAPNYEKIFEKLPPNVELNVQQVQLIRGRLAAMQESLAEARKLRDMPRGRFPVTFADDAISTLIPDHQNARAFADCLSNDAFLLAHDRTPDEAIESCRGILNAGRAMDGDFCLITHLIRVALQHMHVTTLERILAQDTPSEQSLQRLQALLDREIKESSLLPAVRGERALWNHLIENVKSGKVSTANLGGLFGGPRSNRVGDIINAGIAAAFPSTVLKYYPEYLRFMNRHVESAKAPIHERPAKFMELEKECKETGNILMRSLAPAMTKVNQADVRGQAMLRAALVAVACERYRLAHKDNLWPESIDALVQAKLLDAVPVDPFDNQPLRFRRTKDGIVIYSVGIDLKDDGGHIDRDRMHEPGVDIGFRLWNVDQRRQMPRPPVVIFDEPK